MRMTFPIPNKNIPRENIKDIPNTEEKENDKEANIVLKSEESKHDAAEDVKETDKEDYENEEEKFVCVECSEYFKTEETLKEQITYEHKKDREDIRQYMQ